MSQEEYENSEFSTNESKNRLAAAEYDMHKIQSHANNGSHPNLNET